MPGVRYMYACMYKLLVHVSLKFITHLFKSCVSIIYLQSSAVHVTPVLNDKHIFSEAHAVQPCFIYPDTKLNYMALHAIYG